MITNEDIKKYLKQTQFTQGESIEIVEKYIFDRKGVTVKINNPDQVIREHLLGLAVEVAVRWYRENLVVS